MRALTALPIDDDVLDRIFTFCPTFSTLQSLMLTSKAFYNSITRAVAYNIVGPALPQALRVLRYPYGDDSQEDERDESKSRKYHEEDAHTMATTCPEDHDPSVIAAREKMDLQQDAKLVQKLEDIYSLTCKDRTSKTSVLTSDESWRFRRAMYRIMFYCKLFPGSRYSLEDIDELPPDAVKKIQHQRTAVLREYPTDELLQIYGVVRFMRDVLEEVCDEDFSPSNAVDVLLTLGPEIVLRVWQDRSYESHEDNLGFSLFDSDDDIPLYQGYFSVPLQNIWTARKVTTPPKDDEPATKYILDTIVGANDTCSQCPTPGGFKLITAGNWHRREFSPTQFLKNRLRQTMWISSPFLEAVNKMRRYEHEYEDPEEDSLARWYLAVFDTPGKPSEWDGWTKDKSYCDKCFVRYLVENAWRWWYAERVRDGWNPPENCWYGYNCKTMTHRQAHAEGKNHLCVPTRGDP
ncbi:hypothetical protein R3P38DRAFT_2545889 [Favolaschia claudopus]|uniref:F-box domain-containing protein n=1 Tax=Favolaschia claudopus TaxID=2862362 RepID=A0AAW0AKY6_9AGAR